ncbi:MAG TPA: hypothetical protein VI076_16540, partial [Actinopolymorphaceae bacterium]
MGLSLIGLPSASVADVTSGYVLVLVFARGSRFPRGTPYNIVTVQAMRIHVADHPLIAHKLTTLRNARTD